MESKAPPARPRLRFSIRGLLMLILLVAMLLGWRSAVERGKMQLAQQANQLRYAEEELRRARDEIKDQSRVKPDKSRAFWMAEFDGADLRGVTIASPSNAFQRASFQGCNLEGATLAGGVSAFQFARFDNCKLMNAKMTGGGASFQLATFVEADLTGAVLTGDGSSFQGASFEDATLVRARLSGSFQGINISGARFEGADLSALDDQSLASCYFHKAPTYDGRTKFPAGFDAKALLWRRVNE